MPKNSNPDSLSSELASERMKNHTVRVMASNNTRALLLLLAFSVLFLCISRWPEMTGLVKVAYNIPVAAKLVEQERYNEALRSIDEVIESLHVSTPEVYDIRGRAYIGLKEYKRAISDYAQALELDPRYVRAYSLRGGAYMLLGEYQNAINDYTKIIEMDRRYADAYFQRSLAYAKLGQTDLAAKDKKIASELGYNGVPPGVNPSNF